MTVVITWIYKIGKVSDQFSLLIIIEKAVPMQAQQVAESEAWNLFYTHKLVRKNE